MNHFLHVNRDNKSEVTPHGMHYAVDHVYRHLDKRYPLRLLYFLGVREDGDFLDGLVIHSEGMEHTVGKITSVSFDTFRQKYQNWSFGNWGQYIEPSEMQKRVWSFEYLTKRLQIKYNALTASLARDVEFETEKLWKAGQMNLVGTPNYTKAEAGLEVALKLQRSFQKVAEQEALASGILRELREELAKEQPRHPLPPKW